MSVLHALFDMIHVPFLASHWLLQDFDFSWQKLLTLGFKIALAYFTAPSGGLDKSDSFPSQVSVKIRVHDANGRSRDERC